MRKKSKSYRKIKKSYSSQKRIRSISVFKISWAFIAAAVTLVIISSFGNRSFFSQKSSLPCANSISCVKNLFGSYENGAKEGKFMGRKITVPSLIALAQKETVVLGEKVGENKHIYIDLANQKLMALEGNQVVYSFSISSGKWSATPTGDFNIWVKLRYTRMEGGDSRIGTYYNLPNVPYVMYFYNQEIPKTRGFGIHGAYWHNNFGRPMSHGCINMRIEDAGKIYDWAEPATEGSITYAKADKSGTPITIFGEASLE